MVRRGSFLITIFLIFLFILPGISMAEDNLKGMLGQMVMVGFRGQDVDKNDDIAKDIMEGRIGGVILFDYDMALKRRGRNIAGPAQLKKLTADLQALSHIPLFIAVDQEGGKVVRLRKTNGFDDFPSAESLGRESVSSVRDTAAKMGAELRTYGININFAPVVDLNINPANPAIGALGRSFSASPAVVSEKAAAFLSGLEANGVLGCLKHFPGQGSASEDSHLGLPDISNSWSEKELKPYVDLIKQSPVNMIMVGHLFNDQLDPVYPSSLSYKTMTGLLRDKLKFDGVIVTDDLQMKAITERYGLKEAVELAVLGGADLLIFGNNLEYDSFLPLKVQGILLNMVQDGRLTVERVEESARRLTNLKQAWIVEQNLTAVD